MEKKLKIIHETGYVFNEDVFIEPHYLRFKPRATPYTTVESADLTISPSPAALSEQYDTENNLIHFCWFNGVHRNLSICSESVVIHEENNPYNFILFPEGYSKLPFHYSPHLTDTLFATLFPAKINSPLIDYGNLILERSTYNTLNFISELTRQIHIDFELQSRLEGEPYPADQTFALKKGSCRDLSWMLIQLLRYLGIASRFVSGYYFIESDNPKHDLHGWVEVYLPGAGWVGFDPSHGTAAGSSHIPICSSAYYQNTMPVIGSFRGSAESTMDVALTIKKI